MKKKILIGAIALMSVLGGITIFESISGQNEAKATVPPVGNCRSNSKLFCNGPGTSCYCLLGGVDVH